MAVIEEHALGGGVHRQGRGGNRPRHRVGGGAGLLESGVAHRQVDFDRRRQFPGECHALGGAAKELEPVGGHVIAELLGDEHDRIGCKGGRLERPRLGGGARRVGTVEPDGEVPRQIVVVGSPGQGFGDVQRPEVRVLDRVERAFVNLVIGDVAVDRRHT
jgi:hypothetical protein